MPTPILATKLYTPTLPEEFVSRTHLIERLNAGLHGKLTLISAPAGFGKTTLLSEWIANIKSSNHANATKFTWLSLDSGDNDLVRFWTYIIAALQTIEPKVGKAELTALQSSQSPPINVTISGLINEIDETLPNFTLILDDYYQIENPSVHKSVGYLLDHMPPRMQLVIATRSDPLIALSRMRGQGYLNELRTDDLRFNVEETDIFLNDVMDLDLLSDDIVSLWHRTEGWIVGLQLAALSMQAHPDRHAFVTDFAGDDRYIADFLVEEVLHRQPKVIQDFLLQTSILNRFTAPLCDAVIGMEASEDRSIVDLTYEPSRPGTSASAIPPSLFILSSASFSPTNQHSSQEILEYMDRSNLFLIPLDDRREWYRYHHLFAELLRARHRRVYPEQLKLLHHWASCWFELHDLPHEAVRHSLAANDVPRAADLIEKHALSLMGHGEVATLTGWLEILPSKLVQSRPWLSVYQAWTMMSAGRLDAVEPALQDAETSLQNWLPLEESFDERGETDLESQVADLSTLDISEVKRVKGHIATIRACAGAFTGDQSSALKFSRRALEFLPEPDVMARGLAFLVLALALRWDGDLAEAVSSFSLAEVVGRVSGDSYVSIFATCYKGYVLTLMGQLHKAQDTLQNALALSEKSIRKGGWKPPITGLAHTFMCSVLIEWNDLEAALASAKTGLELSKKWGHAYAINDGYFFLITTLIDLRDYDNAMGEIHNARKFASEVSPFVSIDVLLLEIKLRLARGEIDTAWRLVSELDLRLDEDIEFMRFNHYVPLARILLAKNRTLEALNVLAHLLEVAETAGAKGKSIEVLNLQALAYYQDGNENQALETLTQALSLAEPERYIRVFINEGASMEALLRLAASQGAALKYVNLLLANFKKEIGAGKRATKMGVLPLIEPLSEREIEILRLLDTNMTGGEIAAQLHLAPSTVQTHCKNIYQKLDVHRRFDAVQRAGELELL